jgi:hypothetical protein
MADTKHNLLTALLLTLTAIVAATACDSGDDIDPIVGYWESRETIAGERDELELDDTLRGEARIYFYFAGDPVYADFDVEGQNRGGGRYDLELDCDGDCSELDFEMDCELRANDRLECSATSWLSGVELEWER